MWCDVMWCDVMWCDVMRWKPHIFVASLSLSSCSNVSLCVFNCCWAAVVLRDRNNEKTNKICRHLWKQVIYAPKPHGISLNLRCWPLSLRVLTCLCVYSTGVEPRWVLQEHNYDKTNKICRQKWKHAHLLTKITSSFSPSSLRASLSWCLVVPVYVLNWCGALVSSTIT